MYIDNDPNLMSQNMTPEQRRFPYHTKRSSFERMPETCKVVRSILEDCKFEIMNDLNVDLSDEAIVDQHVSRAFQRIRDEVTQPFRTEQMNLLDELKERGIYHGTNGIDT